MFSFPKKERQLAWIRELVESTTTITQGTSSSPGGKRETEESATFPIPLQNQDDLDRMELGVLEYNSPSVSTGSSEGASYSKDLNAATGVISEYDDRRDHHDFDFGRAVLPSPASSSRSVSPEHNGRREYVVIDMDDSIEESCENELLEHVDSREKVIKPEVVWGSGFCGGSVTVGVVVSGLMLGALVMQKDEESDKHIETNDAEAVTIPGRDKEHSAEERHEELEEFQDAIATAVEGSNAPRQDKEKDAIESNNNPTASGEHSGCVIVPGEQGAANTESSPGSPAPTNNGVGNGNAQPQLEGGAIYGPSQYLKQYYKMMYYFGAIAYKPMQKLTSLNRLWFCITAFQKLVYWNFSSMSLFQSFSSLKRAFLSTLRTKEYSGFVGIGFSLASIFGKLYTMYMLAYKKKQVDEMLTAMQEYETLCRQDGPTPTKGKTSWKIRLVAILAFSTLALAGTRTCLSAVQTSPQKWVLAASDEISNDFLIWNSNTTESWTELPDPRLERYLTVKEIALGSAVIMRNVANYLLVGMIFDLIIIVGVVYWTYVKPLIKEIKATTENVPRSHVAEWYRLQKRREAVWKKYRALKKVDNKINKIFDPLFKLLHVRNLMTYAFFMTMIIFYATPWIILVLYVVNLFKAEIGYVIGGKIAEVNDIIRAWLRSWAWNNGKIVVDEEEIDISVLLDELDKDPLGLGKGKMLIHQTFHYKFGGFVLSVFFSMADEESSDD